MKRVFSRERFLKNAPEKRQYYANNPDIDWSLDCDGVIVEPQNEYFCSVMGRDGQRYDAWLSWTVPLFWRNLTHKEKAVRS